jgi:hypothetical protein
MAWYLYVQDLPAAAKSVQEIPHTFRPGPLPVRDRVDIIAKIREVAPEADFRDPSCGLISGNGFSIEIELGDRDIVERFAFRVGGFSEEAPKVVCRILERMGVRALASNTGDILPGPRAVEAFLEWRAERERTKKELRGR